MQFISMFVCLQIHAIGIDNLTLSELAVCSILVRTEIEIFHEFHFSEML